MRLIRLLIHHGINCNVLDRNHRPTYLLVCEWYLCEDLLDVARLLLKTVDSVNPEAAGKSLTLLRNRGLQHESEILLNLIKSLGLVDRDKPNEVIVFIVFTFLKSMTYFYLFLTIERKRAVATLWLSLG